MLWLACNSLALTLHIIYPHPFLSAVSSDIALPGYVQVIPKICDGNGYSCSESLLNSSYINLCETLGACTDYGTGVVNQSFSYQFVIPSDGYVQERRRRLEDAQGAEEEEEEEFYGQQESYWENGQYVSKYGSSNSEHWITRYQLRVAFRPVDNFYLYKALNGVQGTEDWEEQVEYSQQQKAANYQYKQNYLYNQNQGNYYSYYQRQKQYTDEEQQQYQEQQNQNDDPEQDDYVDWESVNQNGEYRQEYYQSSKGHMFCYMHFGIVDHALNLDLYIDRTGWNKWVNWGRNKWYEGVSEFLNYFRYNWTDQQKQEAYEEAQRAAGYGAASLGVVSLLSFAYKRRKQRRIATAEEEEDDSNMIECTSTQSQQTEAASNFILL